MWLILDFKGSIQQPKNGHLFCTVFLLFSPMEALQSSIYVLPVVSVVVEDRLISIIKTCKYSVSDTLLTLIGTRLQRSCSWLDFSFTWCLVFSELVSCEQCHAMVANSHKICANSFHVAANLLWEYRFDAPEVFINFLWASIPSRIVHISIHSFFKKR